MSSILHNIIVLIDTVLYIIFATNIIITYTASIDNAYCTIIHICK